MAILEAVETGHGHVTDLRHELDKVRDALDRTDAVLGVTDEALVKAESAIVTTRHWAPYVARRHRHRDRRGRRRGGVAQASARVRVRVAVRPATSGPPRDRQAGSRTVWDSVTVRKPWAW